VIAAKGKRGRKRNKNSDALLFFKSSLSLTVGRSERAIANHNKCSQRKSKGELLHFRRPKREREREEKKMFREFKQRENVGLEFT
jgi:hypothetical protein